MAMLALAVLWAFCPQDSGVSQSPYSLCRPSRAHHKNKTGLAHTFFMHDSQAMMNETTTTTFMKSILRLLAGFLIPALLLCSCGEDYKLDVYGAISGQVTDSVSGSPIMNAQVTLIPGADTSQTGSDGTFSFSGLDEGQYTVSVQKSGFQSNRKNIKVVSGETTEIVVTLLEITQN